MLKTLHIKNLAIIGEVTLDLASGFTVLTGETGAGKSILLDGLALVLGTRADPTLVRQGAEKAEISAEFSLHDAPAASAWLKANELLDEDEPGHCLIRRVVHAEGRTRAFVNGQPVNAAPLRELGEALVSVFGQNESATLVKPEVQRNLLDEYGGYTPLLAAVRTAAEAHAETEAAIAAALAASHRNPAEVELLRHQLQELQAAKLSEGEADQLEADHKRLANAGKLMADGSQVSELLSGSDGGLDDQLREASSVLARLANLDSSFAEAEGLLASATAQVREAAQQISRTLDKLDLDPASLEAVEQRLSSLHDLARKHRARIAELPATRDALAAELHLLEAAGGQLEDLQAERERRLATYRAAATRLSTARCEAAKKLSTAATGEVRQLGMVNAKLLVEVAELLPPRVRSHGDDEVRLDFSANVGQAPRPLAKVASGGELSRLSLAIQVALFTQAARHSEAAATMVFDEVDAGIGGAVAEIVGRKLRALGATRQVLCVTHLGQVAAQGQQHYSIAKAVSAGQTHTQVLPVQAAARVEELARMLGGAEITEATRALASDLLKRAG